MKQQQQRFISPLGLLFTSVSAIIGSGWLFSSYYSAKLAGPAAILSWVLGGAAIICVAFVFAELCSMLPITGSSTRIPRFTHGTLVSFLFSWIIWLSYVAMAPAEVQAVIQYLCFYFTCLTKPNGGLTGTGYIVATLLMVGTSIINFYSVRWLIRFNNFLTVLKLAIPIFMSLVLIILFFSPHQVVHTAGSSFMPFGMRGVLYALAVGGVIFSFNGFKQASEMAGEARNPGFALPFAIVGSVTVCLIVFLLLQTSFLSALRPENLQQGWEALTLPGGSNASPFAAIFSGNNLNWVLSILYFGAIVAPLAAGLMYIGSSARSLYGISKCKQMPAILQITNTHGNPIYAIGVSFAVGMLMFAPLPGWDKMVAFLTSLLAITYGIGPINLLALRYQIPKQHRPFRLPLAPLWTTAAFCVCNLLAYWSGWAIVSKLSIALIVGVIIMVLHRLKSPEARKMKLNWRASVWVWPYLAGLTLISYLGGFGGGKAIIPFGWDFAVIAIFSIFIMILAMKFKLPHEETQRHVAESLC